MREWNCRSDCRALLGRAIFIFAALGAPLTTTGSQTIGDNHAATRAPKASFVTISGGAFYTIAGDNWYRNGGVGVGRDVGRNITLEIDLFHSPLETPARYFARGTDGIYFETPITTLAATARVTLPFLPVVFVGAGAGVLWFKGSADGRFDSFTAMTNMWILGVQKNMTHRVFARVEGHHRADRHPPFNGINGEIIGVVGVRF